MSFSRSPGKNTFKLSICFTVCHLVQFSGCWREVIWVIYSLSISSNSLAILLWPLACSSRGLNIFLFSRIFSVNISNGYRKISPICLAFIFPFSCCSVVGFELRPFDKWMKCFFSVGNEALGEPIKLALFTSSIQKNWLHDSESSKHRNNMNCSVEVASTESLPAFGHLWSDNIPFLLWPGKTSVCFQLPTCLQLGTLKHVGCWWCSIKF